MGVTDAKALRLTGDALNYQDATRGVCKIPKAAGTACASGGKHVQHPNICWQALIIVARFDSNSNCSVITSMMPKEGPPYAIRPAKHGY